jgi:hypothetical protein
VTWKAPTVGTVSQYRIYRAQGTGITDSSTVEQVCGNAPTHPTACPSGSMFQFVDAEELPNNTPFTYFVRAVFGNCNALLETCQSGPSNFATVNAENTPPVAFNDAYNAIAGQQLTVTASGIPPGILANDTDVDSNLPTSVIRQVVLTAAPVLGQLVLNPNGGFTYTFTPLPGSEYQYPLYDTFKYKVDNGTWRTPTGVLMSLQSNEATVTITITQSQD